MVQAASLASVPFVAAPAAREAAQTVKQVLFEDIVTLRGSFQPRSKRIRKSIGPTEWTVHVNPVSIIVGGIALLAGIAAGSYLLGVEPQVLLPSERATRETEIRNMKRTIRDFLIPLSQDPGQPEHIRQEALEDIERMKDNIAIRERQLFWNSKGRNRPRNPWISLI